MPTYTNQQELANNILRVYGDNLVPTSGTPSITIYGGEQPSATTVATNWTNYKSSNSDCLAHFTAGPNWSYNAGTLTWANTANATTTLTLNTGTATWAILWWRNPNASAVSSRMATSAENGVVNQASVASNTLPNGGLFAVVPVSDSTGTGVIRMVDTAITPGVSSTITNSGYSLIFG